MVSWASACFEAVTQGGLTVMLHFPRANQEAGSLLLSSWNENLIALPDF